MIDKVKNLDNLTLKFVMVGGLGFVVNYGLLTLFSRGFHIGKIWSEVMAAAVALQVTFLLHDNWTYLHPDEGSEKNTRLKVRFLHRYALYMASNSFGAIMTVILFSIFIHLVHLDIVALSIAAFIQLIWNYTFNRLVIWRRREAL